MTTDPDSHRPPRRKPYPDTRQMKSPTPRPSADRKPSKDAFTIEQEDSLLPFMLARMPQKGRKLIKAVLGAGQVRVDGQPVTQFDHPLLPGQTLEVSWQQEAAPTPAPGLKIVHEDPELIVINKPPGLLTVATDKEKRKTAYALLSNYLKAREPGGKIFIIHRLDRETSGLLMFAKNETIKREIQETWEATIAERTYVAVVEGRVEPPAGTVTSWLTESKALIVYSSQNPKLGKRSVTHYKRILESPDYSLLKLNLETGRKHQIRVHMQDIGHPVVGDSKYGAGANPIRRMGLHAQVLAFTHPATGKLWRFETPIPEKFLRLFGAGKKR